MNDEIIKVEGGNKYIYKLHKVTCLELKDKIEQIFTRRNDYTGNIMVVERYDDIMVDFDMSRDIDLFQYDDTRALLKLGYYISLIHPSRGDHYCVILRLLET